MLLARRRNHRGGIYRIRTKSHSSLWVVSKAPICGRDRDNIILNSMDCPWREQAWKPPCCVAVDSVENWDRRNKKMNSLFLNLEPWVIDHMCLYNSQALCFYIRSVRAQVGPLIVRLKEIYICFSLRDREAQVSLFPSTHQRGNQCWQQLLRPFHLMNLYRF